MGNCRKCKRYIKFKYVRKSGLCYKCYTEQRQPHRVYHKRRYRKVSAFQTFNRFVVRHPVVSSVGSMILAVILLRVILSNQLFGNDVTEFRLWLIFADIVLFFVGLISLKVWFKNNVSDRNTQHNFRWKK